MTDYTYPVLHGQRGYDSGPWPKPRPRKPARKPKPRPKRALSRVVASGSNAPRPAILYWRGAWYRSLEYAIELMRPAGLSLRAKPTIALVHSPSDSDNWAARITFHPGFAVPVPEIVGIVRSKANDLLALGYPE